MRRTIQRSAVIVFVGAILGLVANAVSPYRIPLLTPPRTEIPAQGFLSLEQAHELWMRGTGFFLDARAPEDYAAGHIPSSLNLPADAFADYFPQVSSFLSPDSALVCYCDGVECDLSHRLAELLRQQGYTNVHILKNAWTVWTNADYPTSKGSQP